MSKYHHFITTVLLIVLFTSGCTTTVSYKPTAEAGAPKPSGAQIDVWSVNSIVSRPHQIIGKVKIGDTGFTIVGGSIEEVIKTAQEKAREAGADAIKLTRVKPPDFISSIFRISADFLKYTVNENWEKINLSEKDFIQYLEDPNYNINPIEGIWVENEQKFRIAIKKDEKNLSRDFVGYILTVSDDYKNSTGWELGFKKLEIITAAKSGIYIIKYFASDFSEHGETVKLGADGMISVNLKFLNFSPATLKLIKTFPKINSLVSKDSNPNNAISIDARPDSFGSGFVVSNNGFIVTNEHVVDGAKQVFIYYRNKRLPANVIKTDKANDLALIKVDGEFIGLPISSSRGIKLGQTVLTVGYPNPDLQGKSPKLTKGEISSLSGASDDPRYFQISVPLQPGNSGGPLVDAYGNVIGVVTAKLSTKAALATAGTLPENVNYAVKGTFVMGFLESVPEVAAEMLDPKPRRSREFTEVVSEAEKASVMILVYE